MIRCLALALLFITGCGGPESIETASTSWDIFFATKVRHRADWGAKCAAGKMDVDSCKRLFAIHHSAGQARSDDATVRSIQDFHISNQKFSDIGYHFLIGQDGTIFEGRELKYAGAHVHNHNRQSVGICFLGCYDSKSCDGRACPKTQPVTDAMVQAMGELIGRLSIRYGINIDETTVVAHKDFAGAKTACPGDGIIARMDEIRQVAKTYC